MIVIADKCWPAAPSNNHLIFRSFLECVLVRDSLIVTGGGFLALRTRILNTKQTWFFFMVNVTSDTNLFQRRSPASFYTTAVPSLFANTVFTVFTSNFFVFTAGEFIYQILVEVVWFSRFRSVKFILVF